MFQNKKYQVIKNAVSYELANFIFNYFMLKRDAVSWMYQNNIVFDNGMFGTWSDQQVPNTYSHYADPVMETLMMKVLPIMKQETGLELLPTYSYARIYKHGDILKRHKDRPSCEISTTVHLGGDKWPIFIDGTGADNVIDEYKNNECPILFIDADEEHNIFNKAQTLPCYARYVYPTVGFDGWLYNCSQSSAPNFRDTALGDLNKKNFWDLFYNYDETKFKDYFAECNLKIKNSSCRCDRKEHVLNLELGKKLNF